MGTLRPHDLTVAEANRIYWDAAAIATETIPYTLMSNRVLAFFDAACDIYHEGVLAP